MKIKIFTLIFSLLLSFFSFALCANAKIQSEGDIQYRKNQIQSLANTDFMNFVNKHEIVGYRLENYRFDVQFYQNFLYSVIEQMDNYLTQISVIKNNEVLSANDKELQIINVYQNVDVTLFDLDSKTINFLTAGKRYMPSITYRRFVRNFEDFYNNYQFTTTVINVY